MAEAGGAAADLLRWYDATARRLPWRAPPGTPAPDPYRVWLSEVMLQQTTVAAVTPRFLRFLKRWPDVRALAAAEVGEVMQEWAGLGYYARARNLHACARAVAARGGFPAREAELRGLPGLGDYTAAAVAAIAFGERVTPVDANIARVTARLFAADEARPALRRRIETLTPAGRPGDFAQALMDLGATICTPTRPACAICPLRPRCRAAADGLAEVIAAPKRKAAKPVRRGVAFWLERDGAVLTVRRPPDGLLGGMRVLPVSRWAEGLEPGEALAEAPAAVEWRLLPQPVRHVFTHFALELSIALGRGEAEGEWIAVEALGSAGLPTVFRKAAEAAMAAR